MKRFLLPLLTAAALLPLCAETVDTTTATVTLNNDDIRSGILPKKFNNPDIRIIRFGDLDYMPSGAFADMDYLEKIVFDGMIGHIDGYQIRNCPNLRSVEFNGPILSTGGPGFASDCPKLSSVRFNAPVMAMSLTGISNCPALDSITTADDLPEAEMQRQVTRLADWQIGKMADKDIFGMICRSYATPMSEELKSMGLADKAAELDSVFQANKNPDDFKSKLEILKESAPYAKYTGDNDLQVFYMPSYDAKLRRSREYFNLDSIAGNGNDISRIKNLLYWVHDLVRHDGSSLWPDCDYNLVDLYNICRKEDRGLNCRFMSMMLTEALLAEGIPARYITCQSKAYDTDSDCHVITVAWSESLGKWVWVDPTFAAYVTDENGVMLHPGEVRDRLRRDLPLFLNPDANWNHKIVQTKEGYLENYMAKNLYVMQTNLTQKSEPEGRSNPLPVETMTLVPEGFEYPNTSFLISDENIFWQAPEKTN